MIFFFRTGLTNCDPQEVHIIRKDSPNGWIKKNIVIYKQIIFWKYSYYGGGGGGVNSYLEDRIFSSPELHHRSEQGQCLWIIFGMGQYRISSGTQTALYEGFRRFS